MDKFEELLLKRDEVMELIYEANEYILAGNEAGLDVSAIIEQREKLSNRVAEINDFLETLRA